MSSPPPLSQKLDTATTIISGLPRVQDKVKYALPGLANSLAPGLFRRVSVEIEVKFPDFWFKYRVGRGEVSMYPEMKRVIPALRRLLGASDRSAWQVLDCGANIGIFSLALGPLGRVVAVEPNPDCCRRMRYNFQRNGVDGVIIEKAVSAAPGTLRMDFSHQTPMSRVSEVGGMPVPVTTIDQIVREVGLDRVDLLKLDLEEHEVAALQGATESLRQGQVHHIYTEFHTPAILAQLDSFLFPFGYQRVALVNDYNALYQRQSIKPVQPA